MWILEAGVQAQRDGLVAAAPGERGLGIRVGVLGVAFRATVRLEAK